MKLTVKKKNKKKSHVQAAPRKMLVNPLNRRFR